MYTYSPALADISPVTETESPLIALQAVVHDLYLWSIITAAFPFVFFSVQKTVSVVSAKVHVCVALSY